MPNLRGKTWTTTTPANVEDAQYWEDHLISDSDAAKIGTVILPTGGSVGQVLTKQSSTDNDADWEDPASSGHTIVDEDNNDMPYRENLQFLNAEVTDDSTSDTTVVDCKGSKGDPGDAATVTVGTVTTLPAGSPATVTNSGTTSAAVFDFGIPKGADGSGAVVSVNGKTGTVVLDATDVGALPDSTVIPDPQIQSDWDQTSSTAVDYIKNKPSIPIIDASYDATSPNGQSGLGVASAISGKADSSDLDEWTSSYTTLDGTTAVFSGLNDNYGYDLFCENKLIGISGISKTGSGTNVTITYTVTNASIGDVFKLRIHK